MTQYRNIKTGQVKKIRIQHPLVNRLRSWSSGDWIFWKTFKQILWWSRYHVNEQICWHLL